MKFYCVIHLKYGHRIEQWLPDLDAVNTHINALKEKGLEIVKTDITQPIPQEASDLH